MLKKIIFLSALFFQGQAIAAKSIPPPPTNYVYDEAGLLNASIEALSFQLSQEDRRFGNQILVAVFNSLEQEDLVDYTNRVFASWHPGEKAKSNGALLAVFLKEKKIRIEVGYGLEPLLTDAKSKDIILDTIGPAFKAKKYNEGIIDAIQEVQKVIHSEAGVVPAKEAPAIKKNRPYIPVKFIFVVFFTILFSLIDRFRPQTFGRNGQYRGGVWGGGFGRGGGFGGGDSGGFLGGGGSSGGW